VAVVSYGDLNDAGLAQHQVWGLLLLITMRHGPGKLSVDYLIDRIIHR
jgi:putative oxidoreductase